MTTSSAATTEPFLEHTGDDWWRGQGYLAGKHLGEGLWICLAPMLFTWRLMVCSTRWVFDFYCYPREELDLALAAFDAWDGHGEPLPGWVRHHPANRSL